MRGQLQNIANERKFDFTHFDTHIGFQNGAQIRNIHVFILCVGDSMRRSNYNTLIFHGGKEEPFSFLTSYETTLLNSGKWV